MNRGPSVSVIMNCFNGENYLRQAIDSVLAQTFIDWEIVFWDNQSTDGSADIVKSYTDPRIRYFHAPKHTWLYEARNYAMAQARGEFLAFLDVDDWWLPHKLQKQVRLFDDPEVGIVCSNYWIENERKGKKRWRALKRPAPTGRVLDALLRSYYVGLVTLVVRRAAVDSLAHPFDPRFHVMGDTDLVIRLADRWKLDCVNEPLALYRLHGNNETAKHLGRLIDEVKCWIADVQEVESVRSSREFPTIKNHFKYLEAIYRILQSDRTSAIRLARGLPWGAPRLKLYAAMLLPTGVARIIKN